MLATIIVSIVIAGFKEQVSAEIADFKRTLSVQEEVIESQRQEITHLKSLLHEETLTCRFKDEEHRKLMEDIASLQAQQKQEAKQHKVGKD